jgi:hypothetical protein
MTTDDGGLFRRAQEAGTKAAAEEAAAERERQRQEREALISGAIRYSRAVLKLEYDPPWTIPEGISAAREWDGSGGAYRPIPQAVIGGLQWRYSNLYSDRLWVVHPNPSCRHERTAAIKDLGDLGRLFDQDGKPIEGAWPGCDGCRPNDWY